MFLPLVCSRSMPHKGAHCSWPNFNLVEIESRCGSAFSSCGGCWAFLFLWAFSSCSFHWIIDWLVTPPPTVVFFFLHNDSFAPSVRLSYQPGSHSFRKSCLVSVSHGIADQLFAHFVKYDAENPEPSAKNVFSY